MRGRELVSRPRVAVSRATSSAERLPIEPPETKQPPAPAGSPARPARTERAWFSAITAPAASSQEVPCSDEHETIMSKRSDALVGTAGMNDKKRGLSAETMAGASSRANTESTVSGSVGWGPMRPSRTAGEGTALPP